MGKTGSLETRLYPDAKEDIQMRKINIEIEALVLLPVRVKLGLLVRADDDANLESIVNQFTQGNRRMSKADIEDVEIEAAVFQDDLDDDEPLETHVAEVLDGGGKITVVSSRVTDSR
jgi:hypothetical protein